MWLTVCISSLWLVLSRDSGQTARSLLGILPDAEQIQCFSFSTSLFKSKTVCIPLHPVTQRFHVHFPEKTGECAVIVTLLVCWLYVYLLCESLSWLYCVCEHAYHLS